jgi:PTH1 family peptidyl-tRNA hydrolase
MDAMTPWLIVGLGNPGPSYSGHRHNVGAMVVDELAARTGANMRVHKGRAVSADVRLPASLPAPRGRSQGGTAAAVPAAPRAVIATPLTFMNESGGPVAGLLGFYKIPVGNLIVIHDELDIPFSEVRLKLGGGEGGHNGLRSITKSVGTRDYLRVRVGIGRPPGRMDPADYVLHDFSGAERSEVPLLISDAADAVEHLVAEGLVAAQQRWHSR